MSLAFDADSSGQVGLDAERVSRVVRIWRAGGLVAFPTETVYGLGADAEQESAVAAVYLAKGRPADHPLIVHFADPPAADFWVDPNGDALNLQRFQRLADHFWPGPLTMIIQRRPQAAAFAGAGQNSIGLRCPAHPIARRLLAAFARAGGHGIAAPSANRFGRISPTTAEHVRHELVRQDVLIIDGGAAPVGLESTIIDLTRAQPVLLRPGHITPAQLAAVLLEPIVYSSNVIDPAVVDRLAPRASGTLASHYAPLTPMQIVAAADLPLARSRLERAGVRVAVLQCQGDAVEYARELYASLRELDASGCGRILVEAPPEGAPWQAVWDRLIRAQSRED